MALPERGMTASARSFREFAAASAAPLLSSIRVFGLKLALKFATAALRCFVAPFKLLHALSRSSLVFSGGGLQKSIASWVSALLGALRREFTAFAAAFTASSVSLTLSYGSQSLRLTTRSLSDRKSTSLGAKLTLNPQ